MDLIFEELFRNRDGGISKSATPKLVKSMPVSPRSSMLMHKTAEELRDEYERLKSEIDQLLQSSNSLLAPLKDLMVILLNNFIKSIERGQAPPT